MLVELISTIVICISYTIPVVCVSPHAYINSEIFTTVSQFLKDNLGYDVAYKSCEIKNKSGNIFVPDLNKINRDELLSLQLEKY